jgi:hypothetical protein
MPRDFELEKMSLWLTCEPLLDMEIVLNASHPSCQESLLIAKNHFVSLRRVRARILSRPLHIMCEKGLGPKIGWMVGSMSSHNLTI